MKKLSVRVLGIVSLFATLLPLALLGCSTVYPVLVDSFGAALIDLNYDTATTANYALGASFELTTPRGHLTSSDPSVLDIDERAPRSVAVAVAEGETTITYRVDGQTGSTQARVFRVASVSASDQALLWGGFARLRPRFAVGTTELGVRGQLAVTGVAGATSAVVSLPDAGSDELWIEGAEGSSATISVTVDASPTDQDSFDVDVPIVDAAAVRNLSLEAVSHGASGAALPSYRAVATTVDGTRVVGVPFEWTIGDEALPRPTVSPGDEVWVDHSGQAERELCGHYRGLDACVTGYFGTPRVE